MSVSLTNKVFLGFAAALLTLGGVSAITILSLKHIADDAILLQRNRETTSQLNYLLLSVSEMDSASRGYLLEHDEKYLLAYNGAKTATLVGLESLRQVTEDNALQQNRLQELQLLVASKTAALDGVVGASGSRPLPSINRGPSYDEIRQSVTTLISAERVVLAQRTRRASVRLFLSMAEIVLACVIAMLVAAVAAFVIRRDIAARKRWEMELTAAKAAAEQANQFKSEFLSTISHELRTPLSAVLGFSELLADQVIGPLTPRQVDHVRKIHLSGEHLLRLINDILDLSRIEAGHLELMLEELPLDLVVKDAFGSLQSLADKKAQQFTCDCPLGLTVQADLTRLHQVLTNLIGNAIKFTPEGGRVAVSAKRQTGPAESRIRVEVSDDGPGIAKDEQERIFESFYRSKQMLGREGAGLGLTISKRLVEALGGEFGLESEPGHGSRFFFTLPSNTAGKGQDQTPRPLRL
jgi:signal transduction histidine kinase